MSAYGRGAIRIGNAEREQAAASIAEHFSAGRLDAEEFEERTRAVYAARTERDLAPLFADLPSGPGPKPEPAAEKRRQRIPMRMLLGIVLLVLCVAWIAIVHVPPFFVIAFFWLFWGGRRGHRYWGR